MSTVIENCAWLAVGVKGADAADGWESPFALCAVAVQVYSTPLVRPVTRAEVVEPSFVAVCTSSTPAAHVRV